MSPVRLWPEAPSAGIAHLAERHLAKVEVASSNLVARSSSGETKHSFAGTYNEKARRHSQVVRQGTANPRFSGSNPDGASNPGPEMGRDFVLLQEVVKL